MTQRHSSTHSDQQALDPIWSIISGTALFGLGVVICGSIATHSPLENSWNVATDFGAANLFGGPGAILADICLQTMGWTAWIGGLVFIIAGVRRFAFIANPNLKHWLLTCLSLLAMSCFFASWPMPKSWPFLASLGGIVGDGILSVLALPLKAILLPYPQTLAAILSAGFAVYWTSLMFPRAIYWAAEGIRGLYILSANAAMQIIGLARQAASSLLRAKSNLATARPMHDEAWQTNPLLAALKKSTPKPSPSLDGVVGVAGNSDPIDDDDNEDPTRLSEKVSIRKLKASLTDAFIGVRDNIAPHIGKTRADPQDATPPEKDTDQASAPNPYFDGITPENETQARPQPTPKTRAKTAKPIGIPNISLLDLPKVERSQIDEPALIRTAERLSSILKDFGVEGKITEIRPGPVVTLFELEPARGVKSARIISLADDIARSIEAISARMAVVPGKNAIGIELPNDTRETVFLRSLLEAPSYATCTDRLPMALGEDIGGEPTVVDLAKMPHLLIAGTTGSGKSVGVNAMILSLIFRLPPSECRFIMIDPKMLELSIYQGIPHLLCPVVTDPSKAVNALKWAVMEMESRYELMSKTGVRSLSAFNDKAAKYRERGEDLTRDVAVGFDSLGEQIIEHEILPTKHIPNIVVIIDEMADLMMVAGKEIEGCVQRLAQMARAAGIHLITATQRPSVDVITGTIKANFPTRISYMVTTKIDSRTILGEQGAEQLLGMGDLLYQAPGKRPRRLHGPFVSDEEVENVVNWLKKQGAPDYVDDILEGPDEGSTSAVMDAILGTTTGDKDEDLYAQAIAIVTTEDRASTSYLQRRLKVGYNKAAGLMDRLEKERIISAPNHAGKREVLGQPNSYASEA